jgi:hypothetical protein
MRFLSKVALGSLALLVLSFSLACGGVEISSDAGADAPGKHKTETPCVTVQEGGTCYPCYVVDCHGSGGELFCPPACGCPPGETCTLVDP